MKRVISSSVVAVAVLMGGINLSAKDVQLKLTHKQMVQKSIKGEAGRENKIFDKTSKEISSALSNTFKALTALKYGKDKEAIKLLKQSDKKFDEALKQNPKLKLIPVENRVEVFAFDGSAKDIKLALKSAVTLLKHHKTQAARDILIPLKDEMDITTMYLPMDAYPAFIKTSIKQLEQKDTKGAIATLIDGFNTLVGQKVVVPTSLIMAQDLIGSASKLDKKKKDEATKLLTLANNELQKAVYLGYVDENSKVYKSLEKSISNIQKEIKGKNEVEKLYASLKDSFSSFMKKFRSDKEEVSNKSHQSAEQQVQAYEKKQMQKAIKEASEFKNEVKKDLKETIK